jgi:hypothetical protein
VIDAIAGPLVLETLFKHFLNPSQASRGDKHKDAREDDLMYDEGKLIVYVLYVRRATADVQHLS